MSEPDPAESGPEVPRIAPEAPVPLSVAALH
jgi:hypothetical protein